MPSRLKRLLIIILLHSSVFIHACSSVDNSANLNLGLAYLQENQPELAKYRLLLALQQAPHDEAAHTAFAYYLEKTGELDEARQHYLLAINYASHSGGAQNNYGTFLCRHGQYAEAIRYFLAARQDPFYLSPAKLYENAGLCALKIPDSAQAREYFSRALAINPSQTRSLLELQKLR